MRELPVDTVISSGSTLHRIEDSYGPLKDEVKCGLEGCRTPHKRGFIVAFSQSDSGTEHGLGIVGHVCGKRAFGTGWVEAERAYDARVRAEEVRAAAERFQARIGLILPELQAALPRLKWQHELRKILLHRAPMLMRMCQEAASKHHGRIRRAQGGDFVTLHRLRGEPFWLEDRALDRAKELDYAARRLQLFLGTPEATTKEIDRRLGQLGNVGHTWDLVSKWMAAADEALRPQHLQRVIEAVSRATNPAIAAYGAAYGLDLTRIEAVGVRVAGDVLEAHLSSPDSYVYDWHPVARLDASSSDLAMGPGIRLPWMMPAT